jgi:transcription initiation factor TFIIF subunit beta
MSKVDMSNSGRGIWLVKVPKYLAARWQKIPGNLEAAKLRITKTSPGQRPKVTLSLSEATLCLKEPDEQDIPKEHDLIVAPVSNQTLGVFAYNQGESADDLKISVEGKIQQKLECRPHADNKYMMLKQEEIKKAAQPERQVVRLSGVVNSYKPIANHKHNIEYDERKKNEGKKSRDDKDKVLEMLFGAFEDHQYYNLKDLVRITNQPVTYLKEVLKEVCNYCVKNPHKNMWELKPEYRHYKQDQD